MRRSQGGYVLILRGTERVEYSGNVEYRCNVGAVVAVAQLRRVACLHGQIAAGAGCQRLDDRGAVSVVQYQRLATLRQARRLQLGNPVEAFLVDFDRKTAGQKRRRLRELGRIGVIELADRREIELQARTVECGLIEVLGGAHECARASPHGAHQRLIVAARLGGEKHEHLLRPLRYGDRQSVVAALAGPRLAGKEPTLGWGIGGAAQECSHHQIVGRLRGRQIGLDPNAVAHIEIRDLGGRQSLCTAGDLDHEGGSGQVERCGVGTNHGSANDC